MASTSKWMCWDLVQVSPFYVYICAYFWLYLRTDQQPCWIILDLPDWSEKSFTHPRNMFPISPVYICNVFLLSLILVFLVPFLVFVALVCFEIVFCGTWCWRFFFYSWFIGILHSLLLLPLQKRSNDIKGLFGQFWRCHAFLAL